MQEESDLRSDPEKIGFAVAQTEDEEVLQQPPLAAPIPSPSNLTNTSDKAIALSQATDLNTTITNSGTLVAPTDTGWHAWRVLCGAILVQGNLFGMLPSGCLFCISVRPSHTLYSIPSDLRRISKLLQVRPQAFQCLTFHLDRRAQHWHTIPRRSVHDCHM